MSNSTAPNLTLLQPPADATRSALSGRQIGGLPRRLGWIYLVLCLAGLGAYGIPGLCKFRSDGLKEAAGDRWLEAPLVQKDSLQYLDVAKDLADFRLDHLHIRTLGYPLLLVATGSVESPSRTLYFVSLFFHLASIWLLAVVLAGCGVHRNLIILLGVILLLPPFVEPAAYVMTENLSQFMIVLGMTGLTLGLARRQLGWMILGAFGLAYAGLVHPLYQALSIMAVLCLVFLWWALPWAQLSRRGLIKPVSIVLGAWALLIGGMLVKNKVTFDYVGLTPFTGFALSTKTVRVVEQLPDEYRAAREVLVAARDADLVKAGSSHSALSYIWRARSELSRVTGLDGADLSRYLVKLNVALILRAPLSYMEEILTTIAGFWTPSSGQGLAGLRSRLVSVLWVALDLLIIAAFFLQLIPALGATALARVGRLITARQPPFLCRPGAVRMRAAGYTIALGLIIYTTVVCGLCGPGLTRYRAPIMPLVVFLVVLGADICWRFRRPVGHRK